MTNPTYRSKVVLCDAFHTGSHRRWANALQKYSIHDIQILSLPGRNWKWRMHGSAIHFAILLNKLKYVPDIVLTTDMTNLATLIALTRKKLVKTRFCQFFHENQINYPWSPTDSDVKLQRDYHYAFINYESALSADKVFFNSAYHLEAFISGVAEFLTHFPDQRHPETVDLIREDAQVLPLGLDLTAIEAFRKTPADKQTELPVILWNHRWEYDKNPDLFFESLFRLKEEGIDFKLIVTGESYRNRPTIFDKSKELLKDHILHFGFVNSSETYYELISRSDIIPVTSHQDFFGGSIVEAIYLGCLPLLPNRLAYPEHIPDTLKSKFIYGSDNEYYDHLKRMIIHKKTFSTHIPALQTHVSRYDWKELLPAYDRSLSNSG